MIIKITITAFLFAVGMPGVSCCSQSVNDGLARQNQLPAKSDKLRVTRESPSMATVRFTNTESDPIYLSFDSSIQSIVVPYRLQCKSQDGEVESVREFHFVPSIKPLQPRGELNFEISIPEGRRNCYVSIGYYSDARVATLVNEKGPDLTEEEVEMIKSLAIRVNAPVPDLKRRS